MAQKVGKLKIFLGYAAGVGKTYAMLESAHQLKNNHIDVVIGYIEPHLRPETSALCNGLETIDNIIIDYKGLKLQEFNLEKTLTRNPDIVLVDELAHTNCPGSRHVKRYQDIEELLHNGIDVYTTVNIQHIESLNDIVEALTGVVVNERIPDFVFEKADTVELIDIDPLDLIERLKQGKVYQETQANHALNHFFTEETLISLREIALRKTADKITERRTSEFGYYRDGNVAIKEHIMVCISASPSNAKVIRNASRMVDAFHAEFTAIYVIDEDTDTPNDMSQGLKDNIQLAADLGAVITPLYGSDIAQQISDYATLSHVSKIVLGKSTSRKLKALFEVPLIERIIESTSGVDVYVIPDTVPTKKRNLNFRHEHYKPNLRDLGILIAFIAIATGLGLLFEFWGFSEANIITLYILAVLFISVLTPNRLTAILASISSVLVFNYFFTDPKFTLNAYDSGYPVTFLIMFIASFITGSLVLKLRVNDITHVEKAYRTEVLLETSLKLQKAQTQEMIVYEMGHQIKNMLKRSVVIYVPIEDVLVPTVFSDDTPDTIYETLLSQQEVAIASWVYQNNRKAGFGTRTLSNASCIYYAIRSHGNPVAVIGINVDAEWNLEDRTLILLILNEFGLALETQALNEQQVDSNLQIQREQLRSNILRTISHDLRTPLTSISGNAWNLLNQTLDEAQRNEMTQDILDDSLWLTNLVENILSMTRIDHEGSILNCEAQIFDDIVEEAIRRIQERNKNRTITFDKPDSIALVFVDAKLMLQLMVNLLDNAIKYSPEDCEIEVVIKESEDSLTVKVIDSGLGIPDEDKDKIFDMFYTREKVGGDYYRGIGLGLYLCQEILKAHGSYLQVFDHHPVGSVFEFSLQKMEGVDYV